MAALKTAQGEGDYVDWGSGELLAMVALDAYSVEDGLPKSTSIVFRIHQLGQAKNAAEARAEQAEAALEALGAIGAAENARRLKAKEPHA